ncbi:hypothetical protein RF11_15411 [Thelohanellus kitauei]|uniref:Uncharacterized protein n=1 Tax=Thelohanellus kitauei TaxID=669202 RepID=A0A0C2N6G7_THEKT|nr:hypothetical protein RF11_15411 [Thelohanellus kitauei]
MRFSKFCGITFHVSSFILDIRSGESDGGLLRRSFDLIKANASSHGLSIGEQGGRYITMRPFSCSMVWTLLILWNLMLYIMKTRSCIQFYKKCSKASMKYPQKCTSLN